MTTHSTAQEIAEYREAIEMLLSIVKMDEEFKYIAPNKRHMVATAAAWTLDKYAKETTEVQGELL